MWFRSRSARPWPDSHETRTDSTCHHICCRGWPCDGRFRDWPWKLSASATCSMERCSSTSYSGSDRSVGAAAAARRDSRSAGGLGSSWIGRAASSRYSSPSEIASVTAAGHRGGSAACLAGMGHFIDRTLPFLWWAAGSRPRGPGPSARLAGHPLVRYSSSREEPASPQMPSSLPGSRKPAHHTRHAGRRCPFAAAFALSHRATSERASFLHW